MNIKINNTLKHLAGRRDLFDRITKDETGGRVAWAQRKPRDYDNKKCLPWSDVRGRYWYPWG
jgi:hypothetical protein